MLTKSNLEVKHLSSTFICSAITLVIGFLILGLATDLGKSFTTEGYRRHQIDRHPESIPNLLLQNENGQKVYLSDSIKKDNRFVLLNFFYTSCKTICTSQTTIFDGLQGKIISKKLEDKVRLISISFDPEHDDAEAIRKYSKQVDANQTIWNIFTLQNPNDLNLLLDQFGIYVIKVPPFNDLDHNASLHLISPQSKLIKITSLEDVDDLFSTLTNLL